MVDGLEGGRDPGGACWKKLWFLPVIAVILGCLLRQSRKHTHEIQRRPAALHLHPCLLAVGACWQVELREHVQHGLTSILRRRAGGSSSSLRSLCLLFLWGSGWFWGWQGPDVPMTRRGAPVEVVFGVPVARGPGARKLLMIGG